MGVVKSKYWRKKKTCSKEGENLNASYNTNIAPRVAPASDETINSSKSIVENILSRENYEYVDPNNVCVTLYL